MRLLDLYCGEGLAAWGYWLSGRFSEIVGVDIDPEMSSSYSFDFVCADALTLDYEFLSQFDFIHASPPCQAYSKMTPDQRKHPRLIPGTHLLCAAAGVPYVIENVEGSGQDLRPNLRLYGRDVGLPVSRPRYFHISGGRASQVSIDDQLKVSSGANVHIHGGRQYVSRDELIAAFGLDCISKQRLKNLTMTGIEQGIPPAFTKLIAESLLPHKFMIR